MVVFVYFCATLQLVILRISVSPAPPFRLAHYLIINKNVLAKAESFFKPGQTANEWIWLARWPSAPVNHLPPETESEEYRAWEMVYFTFLRPFELLHSRTKAQKSFHLLAHQDFSIFFCYFHYACEWRRPSSDLLCSPVLAEKLLIFHCDYFMIV